MKGTVKFLNMPLTGLRFRGVYNTGYMTPNTTFGTDWIHLRVVLESTFSKYQGLRKANSVG